MPFVDSFQMASQPDNFRITTTGPILQEVEPTEYGARRKTGASKMAFNVRFNLQYNSLSRVHFIIQFTFAAFFVVG